MIEQVSKYGDMGRELEEKVTDLEKLMKELRLELQQPWLLKFKT